jgi:hypothetical protein
MTFATYANQELTALAERLAAAAATEVDAAGHAAEKLQARLDALQSEQTQLTEEQARLIAEQAKLLSEHREVTDSLAQAEASLREHEQAARDHEQVLRDHQQAVAEHEQTARRLEEATGELAQARRAVEEVRSELARATADLETAGRERDAATLARDAAISARDAAQASVENAAAGEAAARSAAEEVQKLRSALDAARADIVRLTDELENQAAEAAISAAQLEIARGEHRGTLVERLQIAFDGVARSTSVNEVLAATAKGLTGDFTRVAVFTVKDKRYEVVHHSGFDAKSGISKATLPAAADSMLSQAFTADSTQALAPDAAGGGLPFGGSPQCVVTAPIKVRGEVLAVIYADDSGQGNVHQEGDDRVSVADLLRHHATVRLDRLTIELKTIAELRSYAKMLLDEVEYVYAADASARRPDSERQDRLQENLRCARQIYQQRVTMEGPAVGALLEAHIAAAITAKAGAPFGRDLALVASRSEDDLSLSDEKAQAS